MGIKPMSIDMLVEPAQLIAGHNAVVFDCRFSLADPQRGRKEYEAGHIPGAHYLDLNQDLASTQQQHGGRHPLPEPAVFAAMLARHGVERDTSVVAYDDSRLGFAARLWWLMRSLGYKSPRLLDGGYQGFLAVGGEAEVLIPTPRPCQSGIQGNYRGFCDIDGLRTAQEAGALLIDSREERRYQGLEEPIDPVAGHIPGAVNCPWQDVTSSAGTLLDEAQLKAHFSEALEAEQLVVYCGSGVTACVNLFALSMLGAEGATLYAGSWSDWCTYL